MEATWRWMLVTAVAPIAWGSTYFVTRHLLPADEPLWGAALRALPAAAVLLLLARELPRGSWWWKSFVLGTLNVGAFFVLVYLASQLLPTSVASTVMATSAGVLLLIAWPLLGERPAARAVLGAAIGFAGVVVLLSPSLGGAAIDPVGVVVSLAAMVMSSVGFVLSKRWSGEVRVLSSTAWQLAAGGIVLLPVAVVVSGPPPALDGAQLLGFAYVSFVATALAFVAWFAGLRHLPAASVGLIGLLNPVTGVLLGTLVAGEVLEPVQLAGIALVLAGVLLGRGRRRPAPAAPAPAPAGGAPPHKYERRATRAL